MKRLQQALRCLVFMYIPFVGACAQFEYSCPEKHVARNYGPVRVKDDINLDQLYLRLSSNTSYHLKRHGSDRIDYLSVTRNLHGVNYEISFEDVPAKHWPNVYFDLYAFDPDSKRATSRTKGASCTTPTSLIKNDAGTVIREMGLTAEQTKQLLAMVEIDGGPRLTWSPPGFTF